MTSLTSSENDKIRALLDASAGLEDSTGSEQERYLRDRSLMEATEKALEAKYADRGLVFTSGFHGGAPMQAFGVIDGMRFYFRFRHDTARLLVGELDPEKPQRDFDRLVARRESQLADIEAELAAGTLTEEDAEKERRWARAGIGNGPKLPDGITDYPTIGRFSSAVFDFTGDVYAGVLDHDEAFMVFTQCVDGLQPVE